MAKTVTTVVAAGIIMRMTTNMTTNTTTNTTTSMIMLVTVMQGIATASAAITITYPRISTVPLRLARS